MSQSIGRAIAFAIFCMSVATGAGAETQQTASGISPERKQSIEQVTREYILAHPELMASVMQALKLKEQRERHERARAAIQSARNELFREKHSPVLGNRLGNVTVVEFFDYRCPYCRQMEPVVSGLIQADKGLRVVHKQLPILGPASVFAARTALVAYKLGKHAAFHQAMMTSPERPDERTVMAAANAAGLTLEELKREIDAPDIRAALERDIALAKSLSITSTPSYVVGDELIPGATDIHTLSELIAETRLSAR